MEKQYVIWSLSYGVKLEQPDPSDQLEKSQEECEYLIKLAKPHMKRSNVLDNIKGKYSSSPMVGNMKHKAEVISLLSSGTSFFWPKNNRIPSVLLRSNVILACRFQGGAQTEEVIFDHFHATAFQYTPLGRTILGPAENIQKISKKDIQDYISTYYFAHRMVHSALEAVKHEDLVEQVKNTFTKLSANPTTTTQLVEKEPVIFTGSEVPWNNERTLDTKELNAIIGAWFTIWRQVEE
ncbi:probable mitochondrial-processing peptidase subunit beta, mitochondrial [Tanacetum coccineum]